MHRAWGPGALPGLPPTSRSAGATGRVLLRRRRRRRRRAAAATVYGRRASVTRGQAHTEAEAEAFAVDPTTGGVTMAFMGIEGRGYWREARAGRQGVRGAPPARRLPSLTSPARGDYDRAGCLHGLRRDQPGLSPACALRHRGRACAADRRVVRAGRERPRSSGADVGGADVVYVATVQRGNRWFDAPFRDPATTAPADPASRPSRRAGGRAGASRVGGNAASPHIRPLSRAAVTHGERAGAEPVSRDTDCPRPAVGAAAGGVRDGQPGGTLLARRDRRVAAPVVNDEP